MNFNNELYVGGVATFNWVTIAPLNVNYYTYLTTGYSIGQLSAGPHTIKVTADYGGAITESSESDNSYTKTITVSAPCSYTLSPVSGASYNSSAANGTVGMTTTSGCSWTADNGGASWITVTSGSSGTGSGMVYYSITGNTSTSGRSANMNIAGQVFSVAQS